MTLEWINEDTLQARLGEPLDADTAVQLAQIQQALLDTPWVRNCVAGFGVVQIQLASPHITEADIQPLIERALTHPIDNTKLATECVIPTCYDPELGPDLLELCNTLEMEPNALIELHANRIYRVLATGFCPGFGYMGETDPRLHLPRKSTPRLNVPAGSVAIAENQTVVYPQASPGGWHLIGQTSLKLVDQLQLGRRVRFEPVNRAHFSQ